MGLRVAAALTALVVLAVVAPARAADLTGTWRGELDGKVGEFTTSFSEDGYVLFEYPNNTGFVRSVELTAPGQIQFLPPGGGVTTVAVDSVVKRPRGSRTCSTSGSSKRAVDIWTSATSPNSASTR